ncbi:hypothetical protein BKA70DRAFT_1223217 [Coprinopsis sp. MPI-PUGE-AT-0042]|nr:hypothetical protein BKA70DRAFT_1223217 [Coprinopsis sp. MPI-PUGE-AT-0042]
MPPSHGNLPASSGLSNVTATQQTHVRQTPQFWLDGEGNYQGQTPFWIPIRSELFRHLFVVLSPTIKEDATGEGEVRLAEAIQLVVEVVDSLERQLIEVSRSLHKDVEDLRNQVNVSKICLSTASTCTLLAEKQHQVEKNLSADMAQLRLTVQTSLDAAAPLLEVIAKAGRCSTVVTEHLVSAIHHVQEWWYATTRAVQSLPFFVVWTSLMAISVALTVAHALQPNRVHDYWPVLFVSLTLYRGRVIDETGQDEKYLRRDEKKKRVGEWISLPRSQKDTQGEAKQEILEDRAEVAADPALAGCTSFAVKTDYLRSQTNEYEIYANNKELSYVLVTDQVHVAQRTWVVGFILEQLVMTKPLHARLEIWVSYSRT